jgi:hypothetical protein
MRAIDDGLFFVEQDAYVYLRFGSREMAEADIQCAIDILWDSIEANSDAELCKKSLIAGIAHLMDAIQRKQLRPATIQLLDGSNVSARIGCRISYDGCRRLAEKRWGSRVCGSNYLKVYPDGMRVSKREPKSLTSDDSDSSDSCSDLNENMASPIAIGSKNDVNMHPRAS